VARALLNPVGSPHFKTLPSSHTTSAVEEALAAGTDIVVTSVNGNPAYAPMVKPWLHFWRVMSEVSQRRMTPVVIAFDATPSSFDYRDRSSIIHAEAPSGVPSALAAQMSRIIWPGTLPTASSSIITTDVDMFPLSMRVLDLANAQSAGSFVIARNVLEHDQQFPICYNVASPAVWRDVFSSTGDFSSDLRRATRTPAEYSGDHGGAGWFIDQEFLYQRATAWERDGGKLVRLTDEESGHRRLDRTSSQLRTLVTSPLVARQRWTDYHAYAPSARSRALNSWILFWLSRQTERSTR
jgi:hypothetical protein